MPRQNRVDPFGRIVAHPARGLLMGNRGCLHDDDGRIVRTSARDAWISCLPAWPGVRRPLMQPGCYTELFFLDEATALAAGHRPCGSCRPKALAAFKAAWRRAFALPQLPRVAEIDAALRAADRIDDISLETPPDGGMVASADQAVLRWRGRWQTWTHEGYRVSEAPCPSRACLISGVTTLAVLRAGYRPLVHPSADGTSSAVNEQTPATAQVAAVRGAASLSAGRSASNPAPGSASPD